MCDTQEYVDKLNNVIKVSRQLRYEISGKFYEYRMKWWHDLIFLIEEIDRQYHTSFRPHFHENMFLPDDTLKRQIYVAEDTPRHEVEKLYMCHGFKIGLEKIRSIVQAIIEQLNRDGKMPFSDDYTNKRLLWDSKSTSVDSNGERLVKKIKEYYENEPPLHPLGLADPVHSDKRELWLTTLIKMLSQIVGEKNSILEKIFKVSHEFCYNPGYSPKLGEPVEDYVHRLFNELFKYAEIKVNMPDTQYDNLESRKELSVSRSLTIGNDTDKKFNIAVVTATPDEESAILNLLDKPTVIESPDDSNLYHTGMLKNTQKEVIVTSSPFKGIAAATNTTTKLILNYRPQYIFMVGIAAGRRDVTKVGHVLIAEQSLDYTQVVEMERKDQRTQKYMQQPYVLDAALKNKLNAFATKSEVLRTIYESYPDHSKFFPLCHKMGLVITGGALVRSSEMMTELAQSYQNVIGLDMETYGVYYASQNTLQKLKPICVSMKSVSDHGDNKKGETSNEENRKYALYTSSQFFYEFVSNTQLS